jgi:hypothetical protein
METKHQESHLTISNLCCCLDFCTPLFVKDLLRGLSFFLCLLHLVIVCVLLSQASIV